MKRKLSNEILDELPPEHRLSRGSHRDLRLLHRLMGHQAAYENALVAAVSCRSSHGNPLRIAEIGAGEGRLLLQVAQKLSHKLPPMDCVFVDRRDTVPGEVVRDFKNLQWKVEVVDADVFAWMAKQREKSLDLILASLFLHHFEDRELRDLLSGLSFVCHEFVALEPLRSWAPLMASFGLGLLGCNRVTRHDGPVSIRAGFLPGELELLWPNSDRWDVSSQWSGIGSVLFRAKQRAKERSVV